MGAMIRGAVFEALHDRGESSTAKKPLTDSQTVALSAIVDWLQQNGFAQSAATVKTECGPDAILPKNIINSELNLATDFRGAALGVIIDERREQKQLEQGELEVTDDDDNETIEDDDVQIIIKN